MAWSKRMPGFLAAAAALAVVQCSADTASLTPLDWVKVVGPQANASLLALGATGDFDEAATFTVSAFKSNGTYYLYYGGSDANAPTGCPGINGTHWRIGLATSTDGLNFVKQRGQAADGSIVGNGASGDFDSQLTYRPVVLKDGGVWRMWYNGAAQPFRCPSTTLGVDRRIGYAESADGVAFTKMNTGPGPGGSVLPLGPAGSIDEMQVGYVWVLKDGAQYKMYYSANDATNTWRVALATSSDARTWVKVVGKEAGGSVLSIGAAGSLDAACAYQPTVVKENDQLYRMWYRACAAPGPLGGPSLGTIGYAESNDGITWVKVPQPLAGGSALVQGPAGSLDSGGLTTPAVILDTTSWDMYYAGFDSTGQYRIGLARAAR
jgi:hypothetical protein